MTAPDRHIHEPSLDPAIRIPWTVDGPEVLRQLKVHSAAGLSSQEVVRRRLKYGRNLLAEVPRRSPWSILWSQFRGLLVALLAVALILSMAFGEWIEAIAIGTVLVINGLLGFISEWRATRSMEALRSLGSAQTTVRRDGKTHSVPAEALVPGDIVVIEAGDLVTADVRLLWEAKLEIDESALTGESLPVAKSLELCDRDSFIGDRLNMAFKGTAPTCGSGEGVVIATGQATEIGRISQLVIEATEDEQTPLEQRINRLGQTLVWVTLAIVAVVGVLGLISGKPTLLIVETSIALAVASVPEGLPILATMTLARGVHRMAKHNAIVRRLSAVETLGATRIICTDKTGTLTENRMAVDRVVGIDSETSDDSPIIRHARLVASLCTRASLNDEKEVGDPLEVALLRDAALAGIDRHESLARYPEIGETPFTAETKMMATVHQQANSSEVLFAIKGAPEEVLAASCWHMAEGGRQQLDQDRRRAWQEQAETLAKEGLRVIAFAYKFADPSASPYKDLEMVGLAGLLDPPRVEVASAIDTCRQAGVEVVMITGDHPETARHIAHRVGIIDTPSAPVITGPELERLLALGDIGRQRIVEARVFARATPEQKLRIIELHQKVGNTVAMTGDGVNDAPALKKADIGIAMGMRGTEVARQASDIVLLDDSFTTISTAIREGRVIFRNIRGFVVYLLSCNVSEVMIVGLATAAGAPLPLLPLHILFLNLVTDVFPAFALGASEGSPSDMHRPPRPAHESILGRPQWVSIAGYGALITASVLACFAWALRGLELPTAQAVTVAFLTLALAQLWHVFNMGTTGVIKSEVSRNPFVWAAVALCVFLVGAAIYFAPLAMVLSLEPLHGEALALGVGFSILPLVVGTSWRKLRSLAQ